MSFKFLGSREYVPTSIRTIRELMLADIKYIKPSRAGRFADREWTVFNWGGGSVVDTSDYNWTVYNKPDKVAIVANKARFWGEYGWALPMLTTTDRQEVAREWQKQGEIVYERHSLTGHSGRGIEVVQPDGTLSQAKLYTKGEPSGSVELRVHAHHANTLIIQKKRMGAVKREEQGIETVSEEVRTHANGWVYAGELSDDVKDARGRIDALAKSALAIVGLDYACIDMFWNPETHVLKIIEINTAPNVSRTDVTKFYAHMFNCFMLGTV